MEIEVGEYVRTKNGKIDKVINNNCYMPQYIECEKSLLYKEDIVNHSKNLVDLIEVGDIVNGMVIEDIEEVDNKKVFYSNGKMIAWTNRDKGIENILTKEIYQVNCYTVERKEEWKK